MYAAIHKKEKQREADRRYRLRHPDRCRAHDRKWREANPEKRKAQKARWYARHRAEILEEKRIYYIRAHVWEKRRILFAVFILNLILFAVSATAYAKFRAAGRMRIAKRCVANGKVYRPRFNRRIPEWATMGRVVDYASPWLVENLTPSQRAYARKLAIERRF